MPNILKVMFRPVHRMTFRMKLIMSYLLIILIPLVVGSYYVYTNAVVNNREQAISFIDQRLAQEAMTIEDKLNEVERISRQISSNSILAAFFSRTNYEDTELILMMNQTILPLISWLNITDQSIERYHFLTYNQEIPESMLISHINIYKEEEWFVEMEEQIMMLGAYWESAQPLREYRYAGVESGLFVSYYRPFSTDHRAAKTYFISHIALSSLLNTIDHYPLLESRDIFVTDRNGLLLHSINNNLREEFASSDQIKHFVASDLESGYLNYDNVQYLVHKTSIPRINAVLVSAVTVQAINTSLFKARNIFLTVIITAAITLIALSYLLASLLLKRVERLQQAVKMIQNGNFEVRIPVNGYDEIDDLTSGVNMMTHKINELVNHVYRSDLAQKKAALAALQNQIHPHFIFNALETLRMMAEINDNDEISEGISALGSLIRYNLEAENSIITINDELDHIENYIRMQNLIMNNEIELDVTLDDAAGKCQIPSLLIQPVVENSIIHGFEQNQKNKKITIEISIIDSVVSCKISDNGNGMSHKQLSLLRNQLGNITLNHHKDSNRIGLLNIQERIILYFGPDYGIKVESGLENGLIVILRFECKHCEVSGNELPSVDS